VKLWSVLTWAQLVGRHEGFINASLKKLLGAPDMITVVFFSVSWQSVYFGNVHILFPLIANKLLLLQIYVFKQFILLIKRSVN